MQIQNNKVTLKPKSARQKHTKYTRTKYKLRKYEQKIAVDPKRDSDGEKKHVRTTKRQT